MNENIAHRLTGLKPDNLLAFLAALGLLRSVEAADRNRTTSAKLHPRLSWDINQPPLRPTLHVDRQSSQKEIAESAAQGLRILSRPLEAKALHRRDLDFTHRESRDLLRAAVLESTLAKQDCTDLLASLMTDAAVKEGKDYATSPIDPTPFCMLFGQGHQHFLERHINIWKEENLPERGERKLRRKVSLAECIEETLFQPWHREDPSTFAFRWDPEEDVRYALMAGNPTDNLYKGGTQHGANCLAVAGLAVLTLIPEFRGGRTRPAVLGGSYSSDGFSVAWPIWKDSLSLFAIRALLSHPDLRKPDALAYLGVDHIRVARRISVGKFMNFTRARVLEA